MVPEEESSSIRTAEIVNAHDAAEEDADATAGPSSTDGDDSDAPRSSGHRFLPALSGPVELADHCCDGCLWISEPDARPADADGHAAEAAA